mmetsp:Transcript_154/g.393  ORF Transcript_154/g.393 Transcript_154/m.393 type:complete len:257 (-) Transcript_154:112-882(-)
MPKSALRIPILVEGESEPHILPVQEHPGDKSKQTLFVNDLPECGLGETELERLFSNFGQVEAVTISDNSAYVAFSTPQALKKMLIKAKKGFDEPFVIEVSPDGEENEESEDEEELFRPPQGLKKWLAEYHAERPGNEVLRKRLDMWITNWEAEQESKKAAMLAQAEEEEGWTLVTSKKGKNKNASATGVVVGSVSKGKANAIGAKEATKVKAQLDDFYRFQKREANRNVLLSLREKFEEDKRKVAKLKAARKFRPY